MLQLNDGSDSGMKLKSIRRATRTERRPATIACDISSADGLDKPPC